MNQQELKHLLIRYSKGECSIAEKEMLEDMIQQNPMYAGWEWNSEEEKILMGISIKQAIDSNRLVRKRIPAARIWYAGIAASVILLLGVGVFLFFQKPDGPVDKEDSKPFTIVETVQPSDGITLTLADGSVIRLDEQANGIISEGTGVAIKKTSEAQLVYEGAAPAKHAGNQEGKETLNTIRIPNGKQFRLTLPDGTRVWLNTATTFTYPVVFNAKERRVTLEGEAYFEVAKDKDRPFFVSAHDTKIAVTGTHFNVSAYSTDRSVTTTLLEGGVNIMKNASLSKIEPGYQGITREGNDEITQHKANIENTMAWYNGYFVFDGKDIVSIMRNVARWYDIEVIIDGNVPSKKFGGTFPITAELDELLADLGTLTNIRFEKNGKEVRVMQ
ncbi:MAG: FecR family protein [Chitinophagaceae bacterium]|nr:FecR family protein [Chitinophagaceae bacterium]